MLYGPGLPQNSLVDGPRKWCSATTRETRFPLRLPSAETRDDAEDAVDQAPFDVLGAAEVRFDPPAQPREFHGLRIGQRWLMLPRRVDRVLLRPASRQGVWQAA